MSTLRKRYLRKKRFFLPLQEVYALFDGSNLKASEIIKIRLSLNGGGLYSVPFCLQPPKIGLGCPLIMVIYDDMQSFEHNMPKSLPLMNCVGVMISGKWYPTANLKTDETLYLNQKALSLLIAAHVGAS